MVAVSIAIKRFQNIESDPGEVFRCRHAIEYDGLVIGQPLKKIDYSLVSGGDKEGVIPFVDQMGLGDILHFAEIHYHPIAAAVRIVNDVAAQRHFQGIAMPVQVPALALMCGNAVSRIEFEAASDLHGWSDMLVGLGL